MRRSPIPFAGLAALVLVLLISTAVQAAPFSIEADSLEFDGEGQYVRADGHVVMASQDMLLRADALEYSGGIATASGHVIFSARDTTLEAAWLQVNLDTRIFAARDLRGRLGEYFIRADEVVPGSTGDERLQGAGLTRCDLDVPCYELQAGKITIDGTKVTIERGWLALKGRRVLPLPRITLDTSRTDEWPSLHGGYDERGLYLDATFTMPLAARASLILDGELATEDGYSLRAALNWHSDGSGAFQPWLEYSHTARWQAGFNATVHFGSLQATTAVEYGWDQAILDAAFVLAGPPSDFFGGSLHLEGFLTRESEEDLIEEDRGGLALVWIGQEEAGGRARIRLSLGRIWRTGTSETYVSLETELERRLNTNWGFTLALNYDGADRALEEGEIGLIRYLHCYYLGLDYDYVDENYGISAGIVF